MAIRTKEQEQTVAQYLEAALEDLDHARQDAGDELRTVIDEAIGRSREALDHLRLGAEERAERLRTRAEGRVAEWQRTLEDASERARRELGVRAVRAQRSKEALDEISSELKRHKKEL